MPAWVQAVAAMLWAASTLVACATTLLLRSCRRSPWITIWPPLTLVSGWWAWLNVGRWRGEIATAEYREAVAPVVPAVYVLWAAVAVVFSLRARRTDRIDAALMASLRDAATASDADRYGDER